MVEAIITSAIAGHGAGPNGEQPINLVLAQGQQLISLLALVAYLMVSNKPIAGGENVRNGDPEIDTDSGSMLQIEESTMPAIKPAPNSSRSNINDLAGCRVGKAMAFQHSFGRAFCSSHIGPGGIRSFIHGAPPSGARARVVMTVRSDRCLFTHMKNLVGDRRDMQSGYR